MCETNPFFRPDVVKNADCDRKTDPNEPTRPHARRQARRSRSSGPGGLDARSLRAKATRLLQRHGRLAGSSTASREGGPRGGDDLPTPTPSRSPRRVRLAGDTVAERQRLDLALFNRYS